MASEGGSRPSTKKSRTQEEMNSEIDELRSEIQNLASTVSNAAASGNSLNQPPSAIRLSQSIKLEHRLGSHAEFCAEGNDD
jgi:hypothetical protein